jgi:hypothetical protein
MIKSTGHTVELCLELIGRWSTPQPDVYVSALQLRQT